MTRAVRIFRIFRIFWNSRRMVGLGLRPRLARWAFAVGLGLLIFGSSATGQERFADTVAVTEVAVPVRVLVNGEPLRGLTREDFVLLEEGVERPILGFESRNLSAARFSESQASGSTRPRRTGRRVLLLADLAFSSRQRLAHALRKIRGSLDLQLHPDDRVAVATYGGISGLNLLVGFTTDRSQVELALDAVEAMLDAKRRRQKETLDRLHRARFGADELSTSSTFEVLSRELGRTAALAVLSGPVVYDESEDDGVVIEEQRSLFSPIKVRVGVDVVEPIDTVQDGIASAADINAIRTFGLSLAELGYLLRDVEGEKDVILLSEGFSGSLLQNAYSLFYIQKALRAFREAGARLHGLDVGGLPSALEPTFSADSLLMLSKDTGGDIVENTNDFSKGAGTILRKSSHVYVLTFAPPTAPSEARFRKLEVKLREPIKGARVIHRPGYYETRAFETRELFEQRADAAGWLLTNLDANDFVADVYAETTTDPLGGARTDLVIEVAELSDKRSRRLEAQMLIENSADGRVVGFLRADTQQESRRDLERASRGGLRFVGAVGLPPGRYGLRVLVRDRLRGDVFLDTFAFVVGQGFDEEGILAAPPQERPEQDWLTVEAESRAAYFR